MLKFSIHSAFFLFIITAISGIWMRAIPFFPSLAYEYENILHAHSHVAILGWAFLGIIIIFIAQLWNDMELSQKRKAILLVVVLFVVTILMFGAFIYQGYATYSIIMSTIHIFIEYWAIYFIFKHVKSQKNSSSVGRLYIYGALISLFISTLGPFFLGFLGAFGLRDSNLFEMTIYFFLHFQYNGWLFLFLIGTFIYILERKRITIRTSRLRNGFRIYFISLFPWYISSIMWADIGDSMAIFAAIGNVGQWAGVIFIIMSFSNAWQTLEISSAKLTTVLLKTTFLLLFIKSSMELGLIIPPLANLVYDSRSIVIGYLHLTLLGFVSLFILSQFLLIHILNPYKKTVSLGITIFFLGFMLNELVLFTMGITSWINIGYLIYSTEALLFSSSLLFLGISLLWLSMFGKDHLYL